MTGTFVTVPFEADPDVLADTAIDSLRAAIPGWEPADGHLEVWLLAAAARIAAETTAVAADVPLAIFREFGQQMVGVTVVDGAKATITTTWTARDNAGYTAPAGTQAAHRVTGDDLTVFETTDDVVIPAGATSLGGVVLAATDVGTAWNAVPTGALELVDALSWVDTVTATAASAGGVDPETDAAYLDRLTAELRLLTPRPILPDDFATLARNVPGVTRALAINGYNPDDATTGNERMVTVVPLTATGAAVSTGVRAATVTYLDGLREVSFVVKATTPTSTTVDVDYTIAVAAGYTAADVLAACDAAVTAYLSPATWAGGDASPPVWRAGEATVRLITVGTVIVAVPGVAYVASLTINGSAADLTLTGVAPLPAVGAVTGAVA